MESRKLLDTPGSARGGPIAALAAALYFSLWLPFSIHAQDLPAEPGIISTAKQLYSEKRWDELARLTEASPGHPAEVDFLGGLALAKLERWEEARQVFERGRRKEPRDKRFSIELAGVAFKQKRNSDAKAALRRALKLDPCDQYANDFLATIYLLEGNLEAALKYWNRVEKPEIEAVKVEPEPRLDPVLLDGAFVFSPASVLQWEELRSTEARLDLLDVFHRWRFDLEPAQGERFNLVFRPSERSGLERRHWTAFLSALRGLPHQTVYPEFINLNRSATNFTSMLRWDAQKRRAFASIAAPLGGVPKWRYQFHVDARREVWDLRNTYIGPAPPLSDLNMQTIEAGVEIQSRPSSRWGWSSAILMSHRSFRQEGFDDQWASQFLTHGLALKYRAQVDYDWLRIPERRLNTRVGARWQVGKIMRDSSHPFSKLEGSLETRWLPKARGDDYQIDASFRAGKTLGQPPFDELFQLGLERDNDLWLRGHVGTHNGRKGSAPLGRDYLLWNSSLSKSIYSGPLVSLAAGPFVDFGRIYDSSGNLGSKKWLWDTGVQTKVRFLGSLEVVFTYGKDLRSGRNVFYAMVVR